MCNSKIDQIAINETKLDLTIDGVELYLPGYELIRKDCARNGRNGGGVCFYVRCNRNYKIRDDLSSLKFELLVLDITRRRSRPILVSTWYRPLDSPVSVFNDFEEVVMKIGAENWEFFFLGDLNVDLTAGITSANDIKLQHILDIYGLDQLITEPTTITMNFCTVIDHCIANSPDKIAKSGAVHLAISDYARNFMRNKATYERSGARTIKTRHIKNFHKSGYLRDLQQKAWSDIKTLNDPNDM